MKTIDRQFIGGWYKDKPDKRDYLYRVFKLTLPSILPPRIDMRNKCSAIEDQGNLGSCTAHAGVGNIEFVDLLDPGYREASKLFLYYVTRYLLGTVNEDSGAYLRTTAKAAAQFGVCNEKDWPYIIRKFAVKPTDSCYEDALKHRVTHYFRLTSLYELKSCLAEGYPFMFGFTVYRSCLTKKVTATGKIPFPSWWDKIRGSIGGHAILAVGYDDNMSIGNYKGALLIRNSWGTGWGEQGYGWLPYNYIKTGLANDFWTVRKIEE